MPDIGGLQFSLLLNSLCQWDGIFELLPSYDHLPISIPLRRVEVTIFLHKFSISNFRMIVLFLNNGVMVSLGE